ncbi:LysE family translocator [Streptomyces flavofungini]|uniref:LysE family translocator n=1 Tax=Streptomyces flavofungini TaxID=68200 RepID=A0ABS0XBF2_9ACTN|nr:LysE family translocator [Streptomyces flavofungini]MBJ3810274.1 LysE family translocator [Streptomyces flavofungini]GHC50595.1 lysine transporter LysE [Streptomyces flavofungini]
MDAQLVAFTGVAAGMVAVPGADFTVVVRNALASRRAGVLCALGVAAGLLVHTALAVAGVAAVLAAVPALFRALQVVGGGYVLYLGARALRSAVRWEAGRPGARPSGAGLETGEKGEKGEAWVAARGGGLREGFLTNALNPKASLTFLSVLPQFVPAGTPAMPRTLLLATIVVAFALLWFPVVALLVDRLGRWLREPRAARAIEGGTGVALTALGLALLVEPLFA